MTEPIPVLPLGYEPADADAAAVASVVRGLAWVLVVRGTLGLAVYALGVACFAWQSATVFPSAAGRSTA